MIPNQVKTKIILFKGKSVDGDKHPLMIQVNVAPRKYKRISIGVNGYEKDWIARSESLVGDSYLNANQRILTVKSNTRDILEEMQSAYESNNVVFSFPIFKYKLKERIDPKTEINEGDDIPKTLLTFLDWYIDELTSLEKLGDRLNFKTLKSVLGSFGCKDLLLDSIDKRWLERLKKYLFTRKNRKGEQIASVTVWTYFKTLRTLISKARYNEITANNPFKSSMNPNGFEFHKLEKSARISRSMSEEELQGFLCYDWSESCKRDKFSFLICNLLYLFRGIPISDLALLSYEDIHNNEVSFGRIKTGDKVPNIPLDERRLNALELLKPYTDGYYLVPILHSEKHITKQQKYNRINKIKTYINKGLKNIALSQGVKINLTTYTFRHTYSRKVLEKHGVWKLKEALGHKSILTTQKYAGSLSDKEVALTDDVFDDVY